MKFSPWRKYEVVKPASEPFALPNWNDLYTTGWSKLRSALGSREMSKKRETGSYELRDVLEVNDRAMGHSDDDSDEDS